MREAQHYLYALFRFASHKASSDEGEARLFRAEDFVPEIKTALRTQSGTGSFQFDPGSAIEWKLNPLSIFDFETGRIQHHNYRTD